jgi:plastocyanin
MTRTRLMLLLVVLVAAVAVAACGGKGNRDAEAQATDTVSMKDTEFRPNHVTVAAGTTVTWRNDDPYPHDVTFAGGPASGMMDGGATYSWTFDTAGQFDYECTIHPGMVGRVTVNEG